MIYRGNNMNTNAERKAVYRPEDYTNSKIIVKDVFGMETYMESSVLEHNINFNSIRVPNNFMVDISGVNQVTVIIFTQNKLFHYFGTLNKFMSGSSVEILLFKGEIRENRLHPRYNLSVDGYVDALMFSGQTVPLRVPITVKSLNISGGGVLITAPTDAFFTGSEIRLILNVNETPTILYCSVLRVSSDEQGMSQYGCKLI